MCDPCSVEMLDFTIQKDMRYIGSNPLVDEMIENFLQDQGINGCGLGVVAGDNIVYLKGYGKRDGAFLKWTKGTRSMVGSISKTLTALGIFVLVEEGRLSLDDSITSHLPFNLTYLAGITVRHLLSHTSGISHEMPIFGGAPTLGDYPVDEEDLMEIYSNIEHPGSHPSLAYVTYAFDISISKSSADSGDYSNVNYMLLGAIIDEITTQPDYSGSKGYEAFIVQKVCFRAGMHSACLTPYWRQGTLIGLAQGFTSSGESTLPTSLYWGWEGPAGGWSMTIGDLTRLMIAINKNTVIGPNSRAEMMTVVSDDRSLVGVPNPVKFGLGVFTFASGGTISYMHSGNYPGFTARYTFHNDGGIGIALLTNKHEVDPSSIGNLTQEIFGQYTTGVPLLQLSDEDKRTQQSAVYRVTTEYEAQIRNMTTLLEHKAEESNSDFFTTWAKFMISIDKERGKQLLRYFYAADYERAAEVALELFEYRGRKPVNLLPDGMF